MKPTDHCQRRNFVNWFFEHDAGFSSKIIFSDEAHFTLDGFVNKQNCRIWEEENLRKISKKSLHPQKCTVWCGFWAGGIIGPFFFEDENERAVTVNKHRYGQLIEDFLWPELEGIDINDFYFQQDGATSHTTRENIALLQPRKFPGRLISRNGDIKWPPRSCDLTPLDYLLWGFLKSKVYVNKPTTIPELKHNIRIEIAALNATMCERVLENFDSRMTACRRARGGHLNDVIFHI